jgi:hypothetical protein
MRRGPGESPGPRRFSPGRRLRRSGHGVAAIAGPTGWPAYAVCVFRGWNSGALCSKSNIIGGVPPSCRT